MTDKDVQKSLGDIVAEALLDKLMEKFGIDKLVEATEGRDMLNIDKLKEVMEKCEALQASPTIKGIVITTKIWENLIAKYQGNTYILINPQKWNEIKEMVKSPGRARIVPAPLGTITVVYDEELAKEILMESLGIKPREMPPFKPMDLPDWPG